MLFNQRIIHDDNGTLKDVSKELNEIFNGTATIDIIAADDKLYIGSDLPFNHRYFRVSSANALASVVTVENWDGNDWKAAVDVVDYTDQAGAALARSDIIRWTRERNSAWGKEDTTEDISELSTLRIYDFYWARLTFSADLTGTTALSYVGHKFADDAEMGGYYPDLADTDLMDAFSSGKTDWDDQHLLAGEEIIRFLRKKRIAWNANQILSWEQFNLAGIHKAAELIFTSFGDDYEDNRKLAKNKYLEAINQGLFNIDRDEDGKVDRREREPFTGMVRR